MSRLLDAIRCADGPQDQTCLLEPGHSGWHKSNHMAWPNVSESREHWAAIGRRIMGGEPMPWLSYREIAYAIDAAKVKEVGR